MTVPYVTNLLLYLPNITNLLDSNSNIAICTKKIKRRLEALSKVLKDSYKAGEPYIYLSKTDDVYLISNDVDSTKYRIAYVYSDLSDPPCVAELMEELITGLIDIGYTVEVITAYRVKYTETWTDAEVGECDFNNSSVFGTKKRSIIKTLESENIYKIFLSV